ncbi:hypothetical protein [Paenibacillus sp. IHBB 10380]|nr:hypothetical protein [Paenibacillus sp. IHBB 10380]
MEMTMMAMCMEEMMSKMKSMKMGMEKMSIMSMKDMDINIARQSF